MRGEVGKALGQAGLPKKHVLGFFDAFVDCEIDVVVLPRMGAALVVPVDLGVLEEGGHGWLGCSGWADFMPSDDFALAVPALSPASQLPQVPHKVWACGDPVGAGLPAIGPIQAIHKSASLAYPLKEPVHVRICRNRPQHRQGGLRRRGTRFTRGPARSPVRTQAAGALPGDRADQRH
ncbi:hypothetical protein D3C75_982800 [compost metagenome]